MNYMQREGRERGVHWFYVHSKPRSPLLEAKSTPEDARNGCEGGTGWRGRHEVASAETNQRRAAGADGGSRHGEVEREERHCCQHEPLCTDLFQLLLLDLLFLERLLVVPLQRLARELRIRGGEEEGRRGGEGVGTFREGRKEPEGETQRDHGEGRR